MLADKIAMALGAAQRSGQWWRCICPVHGSRAGHSATLALRDGDRGLITVCHAECSTYRHRFTSLGTPRAWVQASSQ
jgi:hypothetical protein